MKIINDKRKSAFMVYAYKRKKGQTPDGVCPFLCCSANLDAISPKKPKKSRGDGYWMWFYMYLQSSSTLFPKFSYFFLINVIQCLFQIIIYKLTNFLVAVIFFFISFTLFI